MLASGVGNAATEVLEHASVHRGMPYPESFMLRVRVPERPRSVRERALLALPWVLGVGGALVLVVVVAKLRRRARNRAVPPPAP